MPLGFGLSLSSSSLSEGHPTLIKAENHLARVSSELQNSFSGFSAGSSWYGQKRLSWYGFGPLTSPKPSRATRTSCWDVLLMPFISAGLYHQIPLNQLVSSLKFCPCKGLRIPVCAPLWAKVRLFQPQVGFANCWLRPSSNHFKTDEGVLHMIPPPPTALSPISTTLHSNPPHPTPLNSSPLHSASPYSTPPHGI